MGSPKKKIMIKNILIVAIVVKKTELYLRKTKYKAASVPQSYLILRSSNFKRRLFHSNGVLA